MSKRTPIAFWIPIASAFVLLYALGLPMLARPTNCGGNSAALAACKDIVLSFRTVSLERGDMPVSITNLTGPEQEYFRFVAGVSWLPNSKVLVAARPIILSEERPREILAVCDTPFDNVPRRFLGRAPLTHAVGYSDGSAGLISVREFRRLNLSGFIDVRKIATTRVEPQRAADRSQPLGSQYFPQPVATGTGR